MDKRSENDKLKNILIEQIKKDGLLVLLSDEAVNLLVDKNEFEIWRMFYKFISSSSVSFNVVRRSLLSASISDRVEQGQSIWNRHRVLCMMVSWMIEIWENDVWSDETIDCVVEYWVKLLECEDMKMVMWAIVKMESWWEKIEMKSWLSSERKDRLITALTRHLTHINAPTEGMDFNLGNIEGYQVKWCAKWFEDNLVKGGVKKIPLVKLSRDRFEARNSSFDLTIDIFRFRPTFSLSVRCPFPVKSNVYFYEVTLLTNGLMDFGWSTKESIFSIFDIPDDHSVMLQVGKKCFIRHNKQFYCTSNPSSSCSLNVVGCLLDVENRQFEFYLNGQAFKCPTPTNLSSQPYLATALLAPHQHCHFNFGQSPFKFPPQNIRITTFHEQSGGDERKYRLMETESLLNRYWFKHIPVDNQVILFFDDELQYEFNREVTRVMGDIENDRKISKRGLRNVGIKDGWLGIRYIQAIIEMKEKLGRVDKVDVMAQWVKQVIENTIDRVYKEKLLELLYPYLQLIPTKSTLTQHRSICIVLLHLIKCCRQHSYNFIEQIHNEVFTYLTRTLTSSPDKWTQLFVLIALADLEMSEAEKWEIEGCGKIGQMVDSWKNQFEKKNVMELLNSKHKHRICFQLYLCSTNLLNSITHNPTNSNTNTTLNPNDITPQLSLSPCHLSARSGWHWQSVRSVCQVSAHIYYFEVVLITAGSMTIGWATKRTELNKITKIHPRRIEPFNKSPKSFMIGFDEFAIGYDGYNRCIYHDDKTFHLENIPRWQAGEIVGCLINIDKQLFKFYLNGSQINFNPNSPIYFSTQPYHALISLSQFQQVYLNFGQHPFSSHRPKYIDFWDFYSNKPEVQEIQAKTVVNFQNAHLKRNFICIDSNVQLEDVTITENYSALKKSKETIGNISSLKTIANVNLEEVNKSNFPNSPKMQCRLCYSSSSTKLVRFVCCDTLPLCLDCLRTMTECPKCRKQTNETEENQSNETNEPIHRCTLCIKQRASYRFISCDHFNLCQTCVSKISFNDCPRCN